MSSTFSGTYSLSHFWGIEMVGGGERVVLPCQYVLSAWSVWVRSERSVKWTQQKEIADDSIQMLGSSNDSYEFSRKSGLKEH